MIRDDDGEGRLEWRGVLKTRRLLSKSASSTRGWSGRTAHSTRGAGNKGLPLGVRRLPASQSKSKVDGSSADSMFAWVLTLWCTPHLCSFDLPCLFQVSGDTPDQVLVRPAGRDGPGRLLVERAPGWPRLGVAGVARGLDGHHNDGAECSLLRSSRSPPSQRSVRPGPQSKAAVRSAMPFCPGIPPLPSVRFAWSFASVPVNQPPQAPPKPSKPVPRSPVPRPQSTVGHTSGPSSPTVGGRRPRRC